MYNIKGFPSDVEVARMADKKPNSVIRQKIDEVSRVKTKSDIVRLLNSKIESNSRKVKTSSDRRKGKRKNEVSDQ